MLRPTSNQFDRYIRERLGGFAVRRSTRRIAPGAILDARWRADGSAEADSTPDFSGVALMAQNIVHTLEPMPEAVTTPDLLGSEPLRQTFWLSGHGRAAQFGFRFAERLRERVRLEIEIRGLRAKLLPDAASAWGLVSAVRERADASPAFRAAIGDCVLVLESFHAEQITVRFADEGGLDVRLMAEQLGLQPAGETELEWTDDCSLAVHGQSSAPLAVRGLRL